MEIIEFVFDVLIAAWTIIGWLWSILFGLLGNLFNSILSWFH